MGEPGVNPKEWPKPEPPPATIFPPEPTPTPSNMPGHSIPKKPTTGKGLYKPASSYKDVPSEFEKPQPPSNDQGGSKSPIDFSWLDNILASKKAQHKKKNESLDEAAMRVPVTLYHGSKEKLTSFDLARVGKGNDQEGPGFYFTNSRKDALAYANPNGYLHAVKVTARKLVPLKGKVNAKDIEALLRKAPNLDDKLLNWDEDKDTAFSKALSGILQYTKNPQDAFQQVWYDFYKGDEAAFLKEVVALGYDAAIPDPAKRGGATHVVVFNPAVIKVVSVEPYAEASRVAESLDGEPENIDALKAAIAEWLESTDDDIESFDAWLAYHYPDLVDPVTLAAANEFAQNCRSKMTAGLAD